MEGSSWEDQLDWVLRHTPLTQRALSGFPAAPEAELFMAFHIDLKMIPVIQGMARRISLKVLPCNAATVDREGWAELARTPGVELIDYAEAFTRLSYPAEGPRWICDLGGELICHALAVRGSAVAALEGTTTGLSRIKGRLDGALPGFPVVDWNSAPLKLAVHNEKMVGFSLWQTFSEVTRLSLHGKQVGVLGFGSVGRGIARTARHLGGTVSVYDPSGSARTLASFEGFACPTREELLLHSEVLVTATGRPSALTGGDLGRLRSGAFLLNAGHGSEELAPELREHALRRTVLRHVEELTLEGGRHCYLLARGELLNLGAGFGDTINGFDLTSAQLVQAVRYLLEDGPALACDWHILPAEVMDDVLSPGEP